MAWMQDESTVLPERREIYKNSRYSEGHELPRVGALVFAQRRCVLP